MAERDLVGYRCFDINIEFRTANVLFAEQLRAFLFRELLNLICVEVLFPF
jgi:hypothetical protein